CNATSWRIRWRISLPSIPGNEMSSRTRSGLERANAVNAAAPFSNSTMSYSSPRIAWSNNRLSALSSMTASVVMRSRGCTNGFQLIAGERKIDFDALDVWGAVTELAAARQLFARDAGVVNGQGAELARARLEAMKRSA